MKQVKVIVTLFALGILAGCASNSDLIKRVGSNSRQDVFQEATAGANPAPGYTDLFISSSVKTHNPGIYKTADSHGTDSYTLVISIDGQVVELHGDPKPESSNSGNVRDTESGEGTRYQFTKNVRLKSGAHKVAVVFPADAVGVEREVVLTEGNRNTLTLEPVYKQATAKQRPGVYGLSHFLEGLKGIRFILNGKAL